MFEYPVYKVGITLNELPDYISAYIQMANCNIKCKNCHSKELWKKINNYMQLEEIIDTVRRYKDCGADSVIIFGDINNDITTSALELLCKELSILLPVCVYSGANTIIDSIGSNQTLEYLSFIKIGNYDENCGGLDKKTTNQHLYKIIHGKEIKFEDITYKFWR